MHLVFFFCISCILKLNFATQVKIVNEEVHEKLTISSLNDQDVLSSFNFTIRSSALISILFYCLLI